MSERWIAEGKSALKRLKELSAVEEKDRLDLVRSIRTSLVLLSRSLRGWGRWVNNPNTMAVFSQEELEKIDKTLSKFAESFIEYDIEVTELGLEKGLKRETVDREQIRFVV